MLRTLQWIVMPSLVSAWLLTAGSAHARDVRDQAGLFSASGVQKADEIIREIKNRFHKDLVIETFKSVPPDKADQVKKMNREQRERFYDEWARERAQAERVNGIYILITQTPGHVEVEVGDETEEFFPLQDAKELKSGMARKFNDKLWDEGLLDGCRFVEHRLAAHMHGAALRGEEGVRGQPRGNPIMGWICLAIVGVGLVWLVIALIRAFSGGGGGGGYGGGYGGGGGGFMSGLMGGLFGAMAGNWIYNSFFGHSSDLGSSSYAGDAGTYGTGTDTDYTGTGGDFGDDAGGGGDFGDSGGGDFGGGDFGGGDFGGGDFGGGDFGGGGDF